MRPEDRAGMEKHGDGKKGIRAGRSESPSGRPREYRAPALARMGMLLELLPAPGPGIARAEDASLARFL